MSKFELIARLLSRRILCKPVFITSGSFLCFVGDYSFSNLKTIRYVAFGNKGHYQLYSEYVGDKKSVAGPERHRIDPDNGISFSLEAAIRKLFELERDTLKHGWILEQSSAEVSKTAGV